MLHTENDLYKSVQQDFSFQKKEWLISWIAWGILGLFILLGLLGFFGSGPLSNRVFEGNAYRIEYQRYLRYSMNTRIIISVQDLGEDSSIWLSSDYAKNLQIERIIPEPISIHKQGQYFVFTFPSRYNEKIIIYLMPGKKGEQSIDFIINGERQQLKQFVYF